MQLFRNLLKNYVGVGEKKVSVFSSMREMGSFLFNHESFPEPLLKNEGEGITESV